MISSYGELLATNRRERLGESQSLLQGNVPQIRGQKPSAGEPGIGHGAGLIGQMKTAISDLRNRFAGMLATFTGKAVPISSRIAPELMAGVEGRVGPLGRPRPDTVAMKDLLHFAWDKLGDTTVESRVVIRSILTAFVAKGGSIEMGLRLKEALKDMPPVELDQMLSELNQLDRSNTRVLIDHNLVEERGAFPSGPRGIWQDQPDHQAFAFANLGTRAKPLGGETLIKEDSPDLAFCTFRTHDGDTRPLTGDKVHLSIRPDQLAKAWDTVLPILLAHPETVKQFKIINPSTTHAMLDDLRDKVEEGTATDLETREYNNLQRVTGGAQISIYLSGSGDGGDPPTEAFAQVLKEIDQALKDERIAPGTQPLVSDLALSPHLSYRSDKTTDGSYIAETADNYPQHKLTFTDRPAYQALTQALA